MQALQNDTIIISWLFILGSSRQQCSGIPLKLLCLFSSILFHHKSFFVKYLISIDLLWLSETRYKPKLSHDLICHIMLDRLHWCAKQRNRTSVLLVPGRVVVYIKVHLVSINTLAFSNVLLVLALNFMVHKSGYSALSPVFSTNVVCVKTQQKHARIKHHGRTKQ